MRLLIDECLSPRLARLAHERGFEATHVTHLGLQSQPDFALMMTILGDDWTLVTNNRADFLRLYQPIDVHAGLLIILPSVERAEQAQLLALALDAIAASGTDMVNQLVEVDASGRVTFSQWPFDGVNG